MAWHGAIGRPNLGSADIYTDVCTEMYNTLVALKCLDALLGDDGRVDLRVRAVEWDLHLVNDRPPRPIATYSLS